MKLLRNFLTTTAIALLMTSGSIAGIVPLDFVTVTAGGFNHANVVGATGASHANAPGGWTATVNGVDFDGDAVNDSFTFDLIAATNATAGVSIWGQGINVSNAAGTNTAFGFGAGNNVVFSVGSVTGTTSLGEIISFDGFTGATAGLGSSVLHNASIDINGNNVNLATPGGAFVFDQVGADFAAPATTVTFENEVNTGGSLSARAFDLQFSSAPVEEIPEPSSLALLGLAGLGFVTRRRR